jgi:glycosyltransferase involved in cell wall biosynthesis
MACLGEECMVSGVYVYPSEESFIRREEINHHCSFISAAYKYTGNPLLKFFRLLMAYIKGIAEAKKFTGGVDVLHFHILDKKHFFPLAMFWNFKGVIVFSEQWSGYFPRDGRFKGMVLKTLLQVIQRKAKAITAVSESLSLAMKNKGVYKPVHVVPNITSEEFYFDASIRPSSDFFHLVHVSALNDFEKNVSGIINAFAIAFQKKNRLRLSLVGLSEKVDDYKTLVKKLGIENGVEFLGYLPSAELANLLRQSHAFVMFSFFETYSCATAEALACGLPCLVSNGGALPELVNDANGKVIPVDDTQALASGMLSFANKEHRFDAKSISEKICFQTRSAIVGRRFLDLYRH